MLKLLSHRGTWFRKDTIHVIPTCLYVLHLWFEETIQVEKHPYWSFCWIRVPSMKTLFIQKRCLFSEKRSPGDVVNAWSEVRTTLGFKGIACHLGTVVWLVILSNNMNIWLICLNGKTSHQPASLRVIMCQFFACTATKIERLAISLVLIEVQIRETVRWIQQRLCGFQQNYSVRLFSIAFIQWQWQFDCGIPIFRWLGPLGDTHLTWSLNH